MTLDGVLALRAEMWDAGYRPVPIVNHDAPCNSPGKKPGGPNQGNAWQEAARMDPPAALEWRAAGEMNTGILCDGLRAVDIDIEDAQVVARVRAIAAFRLGTTIMRVRDNSARCLLLYRAATGEPPKRVLGGTAGRVEVLGFGQQFVAYGIHHSGAMLRWTPEGPAETQRHLLPAVSEQQITDFLAEIAPIIGAGMEKAEGGTEKETEADLRAVMDALRAAQAGQVHGPEDLPTLLVTWLDRELASWPALRERWRGRADDLIAAGKDGSRSGRDMSLAAMLKGARFSETDAAMILLAYEHGAAHDADKYPGEFRRLRYVARTALRSGVANKPLGLFNEAPTNSGGAERAAGTKPSPSPFALLDPREWTTPGKPREWIVPDWVPRGVVTALYGDGGMGKSLLAQQLLTAVAISGDWVGLPVTGGIALGVMCEDDPDELHRRQYAINRALGIDPSRLSNLGYVSRVGMDNVLMSFDGRDIGTLTQTFHDLDALCDVMHPDLLVWDTIADGFAGNESSRPQVRQFVQNSLGRLARKFAMGVVMLGHPSVSGITSGTGTSGSTAWSNTARSRMYLTRPDAEDAHPDARVLSRKKANYASRDGEVRMLWQDGCFIPEAAAGGPEPLPEWQKITAILDMIEDGWRRGVPWSAAPQAGDRRLPAILGRRSDMNMTAKAAENLLMKWLAEGVIENAMADSHTKKMGLRVLRRIDREN